MPGLESSPTTQPLPLIKVIKQEGSYTSKAIAATFMKKDEVIGSFKESSTSTSQVRYRFNTKPYLTDYCSSVQVGKNSHIELNSDLVYINHSCNPNTRMDVVEMKVFAERDIQSGEELTFFYPSTEWEMSQPFQCWCGASNCLKEVKGAKYLTLEQLKQYGYISPHIIELCNENQKK